MKSTSSLMVHGALAGLCGAACMTALRMAAHRAGWIEQMVPQAVEVWAQRKSPVKPKSSATHHVADQIVHLGYGAVCGALYALSLGQSKQSPQKRGIQALLKRAVGAPAAGGVRTPVAQGAAFGVPLWAFGSMLLFPALHIGKPAWRSRITENAVNIAAHVLYGAVTALATEELETQTVTQPRLYALSRHARVG